MPGNLGILALKNQLVWEGSKGETPRVSATLLSLHKNDANLWSWLSCHQQLTHVRSLNSASVIPCASSAEMRRWSRSSESVEQPKKSIIKTKAFSMVVWTRNQILWLCSTEWTRRAMVMNPISKLACLRRRLAQLISCGWISTTQTRTAMLGGCRMTVESLTCSKLSTLKVTVSLCSSMFETIQIAAMISPTIYAKASGSSNLFLIASYIERFCILSLVHIVHMEFSVMFDPTILTIIRECNGPKRTGLEIVPRV